MFESIKFQNFKALRDTTLPLSRFTLIVGPNGSGKSTALNGFFALHGSHLLHGTLSAGVLVPAAVKLTAIWKEMGAVDCQVWVEWISNDIPQGPFFRGGSNVRPHTALGRARFYSLDAIAIAASVHLQPNIELAHNGANLAGVLDRL